GTGIELVKIQTLTSVNESASNGQPSAYILEPNFPNPFNPITNIEFRIAEFGFVTLKVYDILGREVATLFEGIRQPGNYEVTIDGSKLASGVYFYKLQTEKFTSTKKMLMIK
ncbi:MAG: T9SS type A sorting domain-containing protein, partial [Bacteroidota bacterium]